MENRSASVCAPFRAGRKIFGAEGFSRKIQLIRPGARAPIQPRRSDGADLDVCYCTFLMATTRFTPVADR